ncbi:hypothetical protein JCGZ_21984 [Jatropha curcas]|uniref:Uncharacterized protein n=1 Tax=Jatropha curcas TaxID=180498 RepID=A0A067JFF0_JATCU|nr:hypothetical protein JCGZ_21984 [Jatropha curcas]
MQKKDHPPNNICLRLFNFIGGLMFPGLKRTTLDRSVSVSDPSNANADQERFDDSRYAIEIHYKISEEDLNDWTPINELGSSIHSDDDQSQLKKGDNFTKKRSKVTKLPRNTELPKVQVNITSQDKDPEQENVVSRKESTSKNPKVRYPPHLLSVAPNINEKSDAFLKSRKEAMKLDLEPEVSLEYKSK